MLIKKVFDTTINLNSPDEIYSNNINDILMKRLEIRYKNKCSHGVFVLSIDRIIQRSNICLTANQNDGSAYIDLRYEASCLVYEIDEVIHGCAITQIHNYIIIAEHDYCYVKVRMDLHSKLVQTLKKGQIMPIKVEQQRYIINKDKISIIGSIFIPQPYETLYFDVTKGLTSQEEQAINVLMQRVTDELKWHTKNKGRAYKLFAELLYPYKKKKDFMKRAKQLKMQTMPFTMASISKIKKGVVVYPSEDDKQTNRFFYSTNIADNLDVLQIDWFTLISKMIEEYLIYLNNLKGFVTEYDTPEKTKSIMLYMKICKSLKQ